MKRICFFSGDVTRNGGTERVAVTIANELAKKPETEVCFLSLVEQKDAPSYEIASNVSRHALGKKWLTPGPVYLPLIPKLRKFLKEHRIDLIIDIDIVLDVLSVPAAKGLNVKVVSWEHSNCAFELSEGWYRRIILNHFTKKTDAIVTLTPGDAKAFQKHFGRLDRIVAIANPATMTDVARRERHNWLITAARLVPEKGYDLLMQVAKMVLAKRRDWKWILCGEGPERNALEAFREKEGLQEQLELVGYVPKVEDYLAQAKIFVLTSRAEGFPMCLLEAGACGLPAVSFDVPTGPSDIIHDGVNGWLIEPFDCGSMAEKLLLLMEDEELLTEMAGKAPEGIRPFLLPKVMEQWNALLGQLLE